MKTKLSRDNFKGPWAGLPVAWDSDYQLNEKSYYNDVERCCKAGFPGIYTGGTTGEFYAMDMEEFKRVASITVEVCRKYNVPVMIGCTSAYTLGAMQRARFAREIGADAIQLALPFWMEIEDSEVAHFFAEVMAEAPGMALSVYETTRAKKVLTLEQHRKIKELVPDYLMVKANSDTLGDTVEGCSALSGFVNVFAGEDRWAELGPVGVIGACASMIYWFPNYLMGLWQNLDNKDWSEVNRKCKAVSDVFNFLGKQFEGKGYQDAALDKIGGAAGNFLTGGLICRKPYPYGNAGDVKALREWVEKNYPEMLK